VVNFTPSPIYFWGKKSPVPIEKEAGRASQSLWSLWRKEKIFARVGIRTPDSSVPITHIFLDLKTSADP
jgi:hypothetical protein